MMATGIHLSAAEKSARGERQWTDSMALFFLSPAFIYRGYSKTNGGSSIGIQFYPKPAKDRLSHESRPAEKRA
jgi:hypothetical protein